MDCYFLPPFNLLSFLPPSSSSSSSSSWFFSFLQLLFYPLTMKLITNLPKKLFKSNKKTRSISRSENPSFGSSTTTSSYSDSNNELSTPKTVLPEENKWKVNKEEVEAILTKVGSEPPTDEELLLFINEAVVVDVDISVEELRDTFEFFDVDHDGKITAEELFNVFRMIGDGRCTLEDCRRMIRGVDKNGDGFVCFDDFCIMMEQQR